MLEYIFIDYCNNKVALTSIELALAGFGSQKKQAAASYLVCAAAAALAFWTLSL